MISKASNTNFKSAHLRYTPKGINVGTVTQNIPSKPVYEHLTKIAESPKEGWAVRVGDYQTPIPESNKPTFQIPKDTNNLLKAKIGDEEYVILNDTKHESNAFRKLFDTVTKALTTK